MEINQENREGSHPSSHRHRSCPSHKLCVFCYRKTPVGAVDDEIFSEEVKLFLKSLEIFSGQNNREDSKLTEMYRASLVVLEMECFSCCGDCWGLMSSFCGVYHQFRCLELQLEWKLETLINIMKTASKVERRMRRVGRYLEDNQKRNVKDDDDKKEVTTEEQKQCQRKLWFKQLKSVRNDVIEKCTGRLSNSQPRVLLKRIQETQERTEENQASLNPPPPVDPISENESNHVSKENTEDADAEIHGGILEIFLGWVLSFAVVALLASNSLSSNLEMYQRKSSKMYEVDSTEDDCNQDQACNNPKQCSSSSSPTSVSSSLQIDVDFDRNDEIETEILEGMEKVKMNQHDEENRMKHWSSPKLGQIGKEYDENEDWVSTEHCYYIGAPSREENHEANQNLKELIHEAENCQHFV